MFLVLCPTEQLYQALSQLMKLEAFLTMKLFRVSYKIFCVGLFLYQAGRLIEQYVNQEPVSMTFEAKQEDYPRPQVCFSNEE